MWPRFLIDHMFIEVHMIFIWHLVSKWTLGLVKANHALNHHLYETSWYHLKLFWSMWCPEISFSRSLCMGPLLYPCCQEWRTLWHCNFPCHFALLLKTTSACESQVAQKSVTSRLLCESSGSTGVTHFQHYKLLLACKHYQ